MYINRLTITITTTHTHTTNKIHNFLRHTQTNQNRNLLLKTIELNLQNIKINTSPQLQRSTGCVHSLYK